jgi:minor capsid protein
MTLLEEIAELLEELGLGSYNPGGPGGTIFLGAMPATPDAVVVLTRQPGRESDARLAYDEPLVQVRVRGTPENATVAEARAQDIYDAVHGLANRRLPGNTWLVLSVGTQGGPVFVARDTNARDEWLVSLRMEVHRPTANRP